MEAPLTACHLVMADTSSLGFWASSLVEGKRRSLIKGKDSLHGCKSKPLAAVLSQKNDQSTTSFQWVAVGVGNAPSARFRHGRDSHRIANRVSLEDFLNFHNMGLRRIAINAGLPVLAQRRTYHHRSGLAEDLLRAIKMHPVDARLRSGAWYDAAPG